MGETDIRIHRAGCGGRFDGAAAQREHIRKIGERDIDGSALDGTDT
jgi:hypothetical protein